MDHLIVSFRRSVIIASYGGLKSQELGKSVHFWTFGVFLAKLPLTGKFSILLRKDSPPHRSILCVNFVKFGRPEIGKVERYLPDKKNKISPRSPALAFAPVAPKVCQGQPQTMYSQYSRFHPKSVHLRQSYSRTREHRSSAPLSISNIRPKPSF